MMLFISDLHLDASRPEITALFQHFLNEQAVHCDGLFILGDLFEAWIGDDDDDPHQRQVVEALARFSESGIPGFFMHGNRDFLIGKRFATETRLTLLPDPSTIVLNGEKVLLSHGDTLCTDDEDYQQVRQMLRSDDWQQGFLAKDLSERRAFAASARAESERYIAGASAELMDVNQDAVKALMREHEVHTLIHGHTHRPAMHEFALARLPARRVVLGDWYEQGSVLYADESGLSLEQLPT